ncbi:MAG: hypothetical protein H6892_05845 [Brucellaceae bacterium]|nr:hypothetical protein [Brucellaceae bacterium]
MPLTDWLAAAWGQFATLSNAVTFVGVAISSAFAAYFGALGAQRIVAREIKQERKEREERIRQSAIRTCFTVMNAALIFKKQHAIELTNNYGAAVVAAHAANEGDLAAPVQIRMDLRSLPLPRFPLSNAERLFFQEMQLSGRAAAAAGTLLQSIDLLSDSVRRRDEWLEEFRLGAKTDKERVAAYAGLETPNGRDERYANLVDAISSYTDDIIFFSAILEHDLSNNVEKSKRGWWRRVEKSGQGGKIKWREGTEELMPDPEDYKEWMDGYPDDPLPEVLAPRKDA